MKPLKITAFMLCSLLLATSAHATQRNLAVTTSNTQAQKRVALVIGNAAYKGAPALRNPVNDAKAISNSLNELGFEVIEVTDATQKEMNRAITAFGSKLNSETAALFFYAGHGMQVRGKNYIIPVDAQIETEAAVASESVSVDTVLEQLNVSTVSIVILDACRNNPFERSFRKMGGGGLAQMDAPKGSFIAYATAPGKTAADGDGQNGLFTQELLKQINEPGLTLESVFKRVRANVATKSGDIQMPWDSSSMTGDFYFKPGMATQVASLEPSPSTAPSSVGLAFHPGQTFRDCADCPEMVVIPTGSFDMGEIGSTHHVTISRVFAMSRTEVTHEQWRAVMGNIPSYFKSCGDTCPAYPVSWDDTQEFIQKLNAKSGKLYYLPSEAQWEYTCRASMRQEYCGSDNLNNVGWYANNSMGGAHPVAEKQANNFGLYDMSGNVWEWVADSYHDTYAGAPTDGSVWQGNGTRRVIRGGSWGNFPRGSRAAVRDGAEQASRNNYFGFRLARLLP